MRPALVATPDEQPTVRRGKVPLASRIRQTLVAFEVLHSKGVIEAHASNLTSEIDPRIDTSAISYALKELEDHKVIKLTTPEKRSYRRWKVIDWGKAKAFRRALEQGDALPELEISGEQEVVVVEPKVVKRSLWRRFWDLFNTAVLLRRVAQLERNMKYLKREFEFKDQ